MEDISRELEKEIAQSKPKPYKQNRVSRILIVDDFGKMKSGEYLKFLVRMLCVVSLVCFIASIFFYKWYSDASQKAEETTNSLLVAQKKVEDLTNEKEVLMARLVMLGKEPVIKPQVPVEKEKSAMDKSIGKEMKTDPVLLGDSPVDVKNGKVEKSVSTVIKKKDSVSPPLKTAADPVGVVGQSEPLRAENNIVAIEKFIVTKDGSNGDLLVRFDIRNISKEPGDVSGRIFTVLKPEDKSSDKWLVVPSAKLINGVPSEYRKGQYFSIAHFKPVKFRIKNTAGPDFFKTASIYIFNSKDEIVFEKLIKISEAEQAG